MALTWDLTDLNQTRLSRLDNRKAGGQITRALNTGRLATLPLALDDPAVGQVATQETLIRCVSDDEADPLFIGRVEIPDEQSGSQTVTLGARDPFAMLEKAHVVDYVSGPISDPLRARAFSGDQSQIMADLVSYCAANGHGIVTGNLAAASTTRYLQYGLGAQVAQALKDIAALQYGPDFELRPVLAIDGTTHALDTYYPKRGTDRTVWPYEVIFEYGHGDENVSSYTRTPAGDQLVNRYIGVGAAQSDDETIRPAYVAEHAASIAEFGAFEVFEERSTTTQDDTLEAWCKGQVARGAFPVPYFTFTPAPEEGDTGFGAPWVFGVDYYLGDTIALRVQPDWSADEADRFTLTGRVSQVVLTETAEGTLSTEVTVSPDIAAVDDVTGTAYIADLANLGTTA